MDTVFWILDKFSILNESQYLTNRSKLFDLKFPRRNLKIKKKLGIKKMASSKPLVSVKVTSDYDSHLHT